MNLEDLYKRQAAGFLQWAESVREYNRICELFDEVGKNQDGAQDTKEGPEQRSTRQGQNGASDLSPPSVKGGSALPS